MEATATEPSKEPPATVPLKRNYGKIVLTLENAIYCPKKLEEQTVSQIDGLSKEIEMDLRILGCELIQTAGILLKLPQVCIRENISSRHVCENPSQSTKVKMFKIVLASIATLKINVELCCHFRSPWRRGKCSSSGSSTPSRSFDTTSRRLRWAAYAWRARSRRHRGDYETF